MGALLVKLGVSLAGILALAGFAKWLRLGGDPRLTDEADVRRVADMLVPGFEAVEIARDKAGIGALMRDAAGRQLLIRQHGAFFAGRLLDKGVDARLDQNFLTIGTSDRQFGKVTLNLGDAAASWAAGLRRLA